MGARLLEEQLMDIRKNPELVDAINRILSDGGIAEVKYDAAFKRVAVVRIDRRVVYPPRERKMV